MKFRILLIVMLFFVFNNVQATENNIDGSVQSELSLFLCPNDNIKIYYDEETERIPKTISDYLEKVPAEMKLGTKQIILLSYKNENVAGVSKDETIYLYDFNSYSTSTQKYIIYHEVAHNWGNYLMQLKIIDYGYTEYSEVVKKDNNYITDYSKSYIKEKGRYSEDFADAVAEYLKNKNSFSKKYTNRANYIEKIIKKQKLKELFKNMQEFRKIEFYLYNYTNLGKMIKEIESEYIDLISGSVATWLKSQKEDSNTLEEQVICMIDDNRINEYKKWQVFLDEILVFLCEEYPVLFDFVSMKYIEKQDNTYIKNELQINDKELRKVRKTMITWIWINAIDEDLIC